MVYIFLVLLALISGLGIVKVATGIVVQQSFKLAMTDYSIHKQYASRHLKKEGWLATRRVFKKLQEARDLSISKEITNRSLAMRNFLKLWRYAASKDCPDN